MSKSLGYAEEAGSRPNIPINHGFLDRLPEKAAILDLGCGGGDHARALARLGHTVYACDPGVGVAAGVPERSIEVFDSGGKVVFFNSSAETVTEKIKRLPSKPHDFDAVWMQYSIPFVSDIGAALNNIEQHLKVGGVFYTSFFEPEPSIDSTTEFATYKPEQLAELFEKNKLPFKIQVCQLLPPSPPKKIIKEDGSFDYVRSGVQSPATILISTKESAFSADMNLNNGQLKIHKIGSHRIEPAILHAARIGYIRKLDRLLEDYGLDAKSVRDEYNGTLLNHAAQKGQIDMFKHLVDRYGLDPASPSNSGSTPMHEAAYGGHITMFDHIVNTPLNPATEDKHGRTPLRYAAYNNQSEMIGHLITQYGLDPVKPDKNGQTPLYYAVKMGNIEAVNSLVGDKPYLCSIRDGYGKTLLHHAAFYGKIEMFDHLVEKYGLDPDSASDKGSTPMHEAAYNGQTAMIGHLLAITQYKLDARVQDKGGKTPLDYANEGNQTETASFIKKHTQLQEGEHVKAINERGMSSDSKTHSQRVQKR